MWPIYFKHSHWWERRSWSEFTSHYAWGTNKSMWMQDRCKVCMDSYMASNGLCFMVPWIIFKNHLLEVGLTPTRERPWHSECSQLLVYSIYHEWRSTWIEIHRTSIWLRVRSHITSLYTWRSVTTLHDFGGVVERPRDTFFGLPQFRGHGSWLVCEVALVYLKAFLPCGGLWIRPTHHTCLCYGQEKWAKLVHKLKKI